MRLLPQSCCRNTCKEFRFTLAARSLRFRIKHLMGGLIIVNLPPKSDPDNYRDVNLKSATNDSSNCSIR